MIGKLIDLCLRNRGLVLLLTLVLIAAGIYAACTINLDAIPDLSDVQVIVRTEFPGQAPQIVEDQVTYPLTTAMLQVPQAKVVRGYSLFGTSFVYVIFKDGTDMYWARSRVLEQLNAVASRLPVGVTPQLGPDATGVGWIFEYALVTGPYSPAHPNGAWHDPATDRWYASRADAPQDRVIRQRLVHHRIFEKRKVAYFDPQEDRRYDSVDAAPAEARARLQPVVLIRGYDRCPLDGTPLVDSTVTLPELRSLQDWYLRYELTAVPNVSEVAAIGGMVKQYQVTVDPVKLLAYNLTLKEVKSAIQRSNLDVGGRLIEQSETEYMVRGLGYLGTLSDAELAKAQANGQSIEDLRTQRVIAELREVVLRATPMGSPVYLSDVADVRTGPDIRRCVADWNGAGETVGGVIIMRSGENALTTIDGVKARLSELEKGLPPGVEIETAYDRSDLIERAVHTLAHTLIEEIVIVTLICLLFLLHARSALVAAFVLPTGVLASLLLMKLCGINANIMSLGGIAIAIGVMVDSSIIMVENAHKHLEWEKTRVAGGAPPRPRLTVIAEASREVGPSLFFALLIIVVSFLPIFVLGEQAGRLFKPLAFTKSFAMAAGAILAVTAVPVLMYFFVSERTAPRTWPRFFRWLFYAAVILVPASVLATIPLPDFEAWRGWLVGVWIALAALVTLPQAIPAEQRNPVSRVLEAIYNPAFVLAMRFRWAVLGLALLVLAATWFPFQRLGSEFMPPLEEGDLLYMPTTDPGISMTKARELLSQTDRIIKQFPEVKTVFGKAGRADTATDPAPPSMFETTVVLERDRRKWPQVPVARCYADWPNWARWLPEKIWPDTRSITVDELVYGYVLPGGANPIHVPGLNDALQIPGLTNAWTMPIRTRIDMLSTGIKTPVGIKVMGPDLKTLAALAEQIAEVLKTDPATADFTASAFPEKSVGGDYCDVAIDRAKIARYGLNVGDVQDTIQSAMGGMNISQTIEGLERYQINLRYPRDLRNNIEAMKQTLIATPQGAQIPLGQLAEFTIHKGPPMVKSENGRLTSWVYVDITGLDVGTYVQRAQAAVVKKVTLPQSYTLVWSGQYQYMQEAAARLWIAVPLTLVLIVVLLYAATRSWLRVGIVLLALPFSLIGATWMLYFLDYHLSLAVAVGMIALAGLDAETGIVMLLYLETSFARFQTEGRMRSRDDLWHAVHDGAVKRIRPKMMTVLAAGLGLVPLLWAQGAGADTMRRLAAPMIGGLTTSFVMELLLYPVIFYVLQSFLHRAAFDRLADEPQQT
ncbi:MAG: efflux RND transporter permease subunit [Planctomycetota bacterium]